MRIEKVLVSDAEELLSIYAPYVLNTAISFEYDVPSLEEFQERIRTISSRYPYLKAVDDNGMIVGYCYANSFKSRKAYDWAVETTIYVKEGYHKLGIGRLIYTALENALDGMGILNLNACIAYAEVEDKYLTNDSMRFHEKMGYKLVGTFHKCGYKFNNWYNMIWMEKMINEHVTNQPMVKFGDY